MAAISRNQENDNILDSMNNSDIQQLTKMLNNAIIYANMSIWCEFNERDGPLKLKLPLLHIAASKGNCMIASLLIEFGANPNAIDKYGTTAIHWAATAGQTRMIKLLLKHSANMNQRDFFGMTALHSAAYSGKTKAVKYLLRMGADKTIKSKDNQVALDLAQRNNNKNCINVLIKVKTKVTKPNKARKKRKPPSETSESCESNESCESYQSLSTFESYNSSSDNTNALKYQSEKLRKDIKSLQSETKNLKSAHKKQEKAKLKQNSVKKQMMKELKEMKNKLIALKKKHTTKQLIIIKQNQKIKALKKEKIKTKYNVNTKQLKKHLLHKLIILQKINAENERFQCEKMQIEHNMSVINNVQKQTDETPSKVTILEEKELNFNHWIRNIVCLPFYIVKFEKYQYNRLDVVKHLDGDELKQIGIKNYHHRAKFLKKIQALRETNQT